MGNCQQSRSRRLGNAMVVVVLALLVVAAYGPGILTANLLWADDLKLYFVPALSFSQWAVFDQGLPPYWDPYTFAGHPFIASYQPAFLYPPVLALLAAVTPPVAANLLQVVHFIAAGYFMFLLARYYTGGEVGAGLVAGLTYAFSGYLLTHVAYGHLTIIMTYAWLPLIILFNEYWHTTGRIRHLALMAVAVALLLLAGHPQISFYTLLVWSIRHLYLTHRAWRSRAPWLRSLLQPLLFLLVGVLLAAPQLLPVYELQKHLIRLAMVNNYDFFTYWSLEPQSLVRIISPGFFGSVRGGDYWHLVWARLISHEEFVCWLGVVPLLLGSYYLAAGRRSAVVRFYLALLVFALAVSLGKYTPVYRLLYDYFPGFNLFRWPIRFMFVYAFAGAVLAGALWQRFWEGWRAAGNAARNRRFVRSLGLAWLLLTLVVMVWVGGRQLWEGALAGVARDIYEASSTPKQFALDHYLDKLPVLTGTMTVSLLRVYGLLTALTVVIALLRHGRLRPTSAKFLLLAIVAADLIGFARGFAVYEPGLYPEIPPDVLASIPVSSRVWLDSGIAGRNAGFYYRLKNIDGYDPMVLTSYYHYIQPCAGSDVTAIIPLGTPDVTSDRLRDLNVNYLLLRGGALLAAAGWQNIHTGTGVALYRRRAAVSRSVFALPDGVALTIKTETEAMGRYDWVIENPIEQPVALSQVYYPGWQLAVNGAPAEVSRAAGLFPRFLCPAGEVRVSYSYQPVIFRYGLGLLCLGVMLGAGLLLYDRARENCSGLG